MNIRFQNLKIENFLSFGNAELSLDNRGYVLLEGINLNPEDKSKSNGSGKSALWEALSWCLTGETIRGISSNLSNIHLDGGCKVEVNFSIDNDSYRIIRSKDHRELGSNLRIYINGIDKSGKGLRDTEKLLNDFLPDLNSSLIGSVIILGQGLPQRFTNNTPSGRKEILEKLSKSDFMIEDIKNRLGERYSYLNSKIRSLDDSLLEKNTLIKRIEDHLKSLREDLNNLKEESDLIQHISSTSEELKSINNDIKCLEEEYSLNSKDLEENKDLFNEKSKEKESKVIQLDNNYLNKERDLKLNLDSLDNKIASLTKEINNLKSIKDVCPTCGQKIPGVIKPDTTSQEAQLEEYKKEYLNIKDSFTPLREEKKDLLNKLDVEYNSLLEDLKSKILEKKNLLSEIDARLKSLNKDLISKNELLFKYSNERENLKNAKESLTNFISKNEKELNTLKDEILYINNEREAFTKRQESVSKMLTAAKRDFRGHLLANVISFIDSKAKEYCKELFGNNNIKFELDKNNILISYDDKLYENLSGGEKQKIDIIIQLSIRDMLCQFSNFSSNILVMDEIFDGLDSMACSGVIDLISNKLTDIESIFIITHHSDIPVSADSKLTVIKNELGISTLK